MEYRHPELHQSPEILSMPTTRNASAEIELGQHTDGRWMWAISWREGFTASGFCCGAKWGRFAGTRQAALNGAIEEMKAATKAEARAWAETLVSVQRDLFVPDND